MPSTATRSIQPAGFDGVLDAPGAGSLSGGLWGDCPLLALYLNPTLGHQEFDTFTAFDADDDYVVTQATAGTADVIDGDGGLLQLDSNSTTADQGIQVQHKTETFKLEAGKTIWFEARVKVVDTLTKCQFFAGLANLDTTLIASGEISATDYVGFLSDATKMGSASAGKWDFELYDGVTAEAVSNAVTPAEDTWVRIGFKIEGVTTATPYVNGVAGTAITIADAPDTEMAVSFVCQTEGLNDPILTVDWYRCVKADSTTESLLAGASG